MLSNFTNKLRRWDNGDLALIEDVCALKIEKGRWTSFNRVSAQGKDLINNKHQFRCGCKSVYDKASKMVSKGVNVLIGSCTTICCTNFIYIVPESVEIQVEGSLAMATLTWALPFEAPRIPLNCGIIIIFRYAGFQNLAANVFESIGFKVKIVEIRKWNCFDCKSMSLVGHDCISVCYTIRVIEHTVASRKLSLAVPAEIFMIPSIRCWRLEPEWIFLCWRS